jgi:hypothetical protein
MFFSFHKKEGHRQEEKQGEEAAAKVKGSSCCIHRATSFESRLYPLRKW